MGLRKKDQRTNLPGAGPKRATRSPKNDAAVLNPLRFAEPVVVKSRESLIAELAYFRALRRGFEPGHDLEDWLAAEAEIEKREGAHSEH
jgi:hypothetical protein